MYQEKYKSLNLRRISRNILWFVPSCTQVSDKDPYYEKDNSSEFIYPGSRKSYKNSCYDFAGFNNFTFFVNDRYVVNALIK